MGIYDPPFVRAERARRGWSIEELADRSAIDAAYLADFERGSRWLPPAYADRLETALRHAIVGEADSASPTRQPRECSSGVLARLGVGAALVALAFAGVRNCLRRSADVELVDW